MMSDFDSEEICIKPYRPEWGEKFAEERSRLEAVLAGHSHEVEHIGSTAVPDMPAKDIVDIALRLETMDVLSELIPRFESLGYRYFGEFGLPGREYFTKGHPREYNLHVVGRDSEHWKRWIVFRNVLIQNKNVRQSYVKLKRDLARRYRYERSRYTQGKTDFINSILKDHI